MVLNDLLLAGSDNDKLVARNPTLSSLPRKTPNILKPLGDVRDAKWNPPKTMESLLPRRVNRWVVRRWKKLLTWEKPKEKVKEVQNTTTKLTIRVKQEKCKGNSR